MVAPHTGLTNMNQAIPASSKNRLPVPIVPRETQRRAPLLNELFATLVGRGKSLLLRTRVDDLDVDLVSLSEILLSRRGEAAGVAIAERLLSKYRTSSDEDRKSFHLALARRFGTDLERLNEPVPMRTSPVTTPIQYSK